MPKPSNVKISPVSISHGSLNITIKSFPIISQPSPFSQGQTTVFNNQVPNVNEDEVENSTYSIEGASNAQEVAALTPFLKKMSLQERKAGSYVQLGMIRGAFVFQLHRGWCTQGNWRMARPEAPPCRHLSRHLPPQQGL